MTNVYGTAQNGSFVPVVQGATTAGTATYTTRFGMFNRENNFVKFTLRVDWSALAGQVGRLQIRCASLPAPSLETPTCFTIQSGAIGTTRVDAPISSDGTNTLIDFYNVDAAGARTGIDSADASYADGAIINVAGTYYTTA